MQRLGLHSALLLALAGCATLQPASEPVTGNFAPKPLSHDKTMADDAVLQLLLSYPPATTRFEVRQPAADAFGAGLVAALRRQGYAIQEQAAVIPVAPVAAASQPEGGGQPAAVPLRYVVDQASGLALYRMTLLLGEKALSRAYVVQDDTVHPAGNWMRRE